MRISNWNTPQFGRCYVEDLAFLYLPQVMVDTVQALVADAGSRLPTSGGVLIGRPGPVRVHLQSDGATVVMGGASSATALSWAPRGSATKRMSIGSGSARRSTMLKTLFLTEAIRAKALVRGIFYPTAAHVDEHLELTAEAAQHAASVSAHALDGSAASVSLPAAPRRPL